MLTHNLVRLEKAKAEPRSAPSVPSTCFSASCIWALSRAHSENWQRCCNDASGAWYQSLNEERPGRKFDRAVKALPQRYTSVSSKKTLTELNGITPPGVFFYPSLPLPIARLGCFSSIVIVITGFLSRLACKLTAKKNHSNCYHLCPR